MTVRPQVLSAILIVGIATSTATAFAQQGEAVYAKVAHSVFVLRVSDDNGAEVGIATGFVVAANVLLTNAHVVNAGHVSVQVGPISLPCEVQRVDQVNDAYVCEAGREYFFANVLDDALGVERKCIEVAASKPRSESTVQTMIAALTAYPIHPGSTGCAQTMEPAPTTNIKTATA